MIPAAAVEAARVAYLREFDYDENAEYIARIILEAAAGSNQQKGPSLRWGALLLWGVNGCESGECGESQTC